MPDYTVALQTQVPQGMQTLGSLVNMAQGVTNLQQSRATLPANIARAQAESQQAIANAAVAQGTQQSRITQAAQAARQAEIDANRSQFKLTGDQAQKARDIMQSLASDPDVVSGNSKGIVSKLADRRQMMIDSGIPKDIAEAQVAHGISAAVADPKAFRQNLLNSMLAGQTSTEQAQTIQPKGPQVTTGQQSYVAQTNPFAPGTAAPIPGTFAQQQLPPATPTVSPAGQPGYVGPQGGGGVSVAPSVTPDEINRIPDPQARAEAMAAYQKQTQGSGFVPAQAPPTLASTVDTIAKDWENTQTLAKNTGQDVGTLQNIKKFAKGAITGVESDRRTYISGIAGLLGLQAGEIGKTNTDLLIKNANMQALGGNTDAARVLLEGANPNSHMTKEAIIDAADQVIAQRKMIAEKQKILRPIKNAIDSGLLAPAAYNDAMTKLNKIDPRILQLPEMTKEEKVKMLSAMTPPQRESFINMVDQAHSMGIGRE